MAERMILHHTYANGVAFDVSEHGNHGELAGAVSPTPAFGGVMQFTGDDSAINVRPSNTFTDLRSLRIRVRFMWGPDGDSFHRHSLVEGDGSFSFVVSPMGSIVGEILDRNGSWEAVTSPFGAIEPNQWIEAEFHHDGISHARVWVNSALVAESFDIEGPVRSVQAGVSVGHYPHPFRPTSFEGYIDDVKIWAYDPKPDVQRLVDSCCLDRTAVDRLLDKARASGWDSARAGALVGEMFDMGTEIAAATRAGDATRTRALDGLARDFVLSVTTKDTNALVDTITQTYNVMLDQLTEAEILDYGTRALDQLRRSPVGSLLFDKHGLDFSHVRDAAAILCLDGMVPGDGDGDGERTPERPIRRDGDPDTDGPDGVRPDDWNAGVNPPPPDEPGRPKRDPGTDEDGNR